MKAVILSLNSKYIHSSLAPWYLKAAVKEICADADISTVECTINGTLEDLYQKMSASSPELLACSCYIWNITKTLQLAEKYKRENPDAYVVLGGPEVSYRAEDILKNYPFVDAVICGEGEKPFSQLYARLSEGKGLGGIEGVSYRLNDELILGNPNITDAEPPSPYCEEFFSQLEGRIVYIEGSRGCPFNCAFCLSGRCGTVRYFGLSRVKNDILLVGNSGAKTVKFVDRTFNANRQRAMEIWSFIIENSGKLFPKDICFHFEIAGDLLDEKSLQLLRTAPRGIIQVEIGLQSFNQETLKSINRKTDINKLISNIRKLISFRNIHTHIDLIAGLPYEDISSFKNSFNTAYELKADNLQLGFLKLLHGAPMRENRDLYPCEFSSAPPYEVTSTPWLTSEELASLKNMEDALERLYNSGKFKNTLSFLIEDKDNEPFSFFFNLGNALKNIDNISLNEYISQLYICLSKSEQSYNERLRDCLVLDKLMCDASGYIPKPLQINDPRLKLYKRDFNRIYGGGGKKLGIALLYSESRAVCVDYSQKDELGNYLLHELPLPPISQV